jgi:hypothetical protein
MNDTDKLRTLEGLGYCSALMIVASLLGNDEVLEYFYRSGIALGLIVVVRMLTVHLQRREKTRGGEPARGTFDPSQDRGDEVTR